MDVITWPVDVNTSFAMFVVASTEDANVQAIVTLTKKRIMLHLAQVKILWGLIVKINKEDYVLSLLELRSLRDNKHCIDTDKYSSSEIEIGKNNCKKGP